MEYIPAKTIVTKTKSSQWFGIDYNMNIYKGCCHGCIYCDSRSECYGVDDFEKNEPQEERRLLYVAMTRAKERLYLTEICKGKSMFIKEFEEKLKIMGGTQYA